MCVVFFRRADSEARAGATGSPLPVHGQLLVLEQQRLPRLAQVPLHVVGQQAEQDVRPHSVGRAVVDRAHQEVDPLEAPERLLHQGQSLVRPHPVGGRQPRGRLAGPDHIDTIQKLFIFDRVFLASPPQMTVADRQSKMFGHLVMVDDFARPHADRGRRLGRARRPRHAGGQRPQLGLRGRQQLLARVPALLGQLGL